MSKMYFKFYNVIQEYKQWSGKKAVKSLKEIAEGKLTRKFERQSF